MKKTTNYAIITGISFGLGFLYYAWHAEWIIINIPTSKDHTKTDNNFIKKKGIIYHWRETKWLQEPLEILWSTQESNNAQQLAQATLSLLAEEHGLKKKIAVQRVLLAPETQQLLVFLNQSPFAKSMSIRTKLMIIESILKTLRENGIKAPLINFFVDNQPLPDTHLDFSVSWPLQGFAGK